MRGHVSQSKYVMAQTSTPAINGRDLMYSLFIARYLSHVCFPLEGRALQHSPTTQQIPHHLNGLRRNLQNTFSVSPMPFARALPSAWITRMRNKAKKIFSSNLRENVRCESGDVWRDVTPWYLCVVITWSCTSILSTKWFVAGVAQRHRTQRTQNQ